MTLNDIENATAADIKANRVELVEQAKSATVDELAMRYVQARLDAKMRDEKLAEQGATITSLNEAIASARDRIKVMEKQISDRESIIARRDVEEARLKSEIESISKRNYELQESLDSEAALAAARRKALADVMMFAGQLNAKVAPLLADSN